MFFFNSTLYIEKSNDEDTRYTYLNPKIYSHMEEILTVREGNIPIVQVLKDLILVIGDSLNCKLFSKAKEFSFRLAEEHNDFIRWITVEKIEKGLLIIWRADLNANDSFLKTALTCRRRQEDPVIKIINLTLVDNYENIEPTDISDILCMKNQIGEEMISTFEGITNILWIKYISHDQVYIVSEGKEFLHKLIKI